ncbi:hypothetical protein ABT324_13265 [Saccharopolyspora sp. NPDC000359]|uniref:hypothetical protein n=1 Tax=Saccharopolyspora sp. NPDC000359 TaxID=3154251 RepID=UPI0033202D2E
MPTNRRPHAQPTRRTKVAGHRKRQTRPTETRPANAPEPTDPLQPKAPERSGAERPEVVERSGGEVLEAGAAEVAEPSGAEASEAADVGAAERSGGGPEAAEQIGRDRSGTAESETAERSVGAVAEPDGGQAAERGTSGVAEEPEVEETARIDSALVERAGGAAAERRGAGEAERAGRAAGAERGSGGSAEAAERGGAAATVPVAMPGSAGQGAGGAEPRGAGGAASRGGRRGQAWLLWAASVVLVALAVWFGFETYAARYTGPAANEALVSAGATSEVSGQVSDAVEKLFSYDFNDTAKTEEAARNLLTGDAVQRYEELFAVVKDQAPQQQLIVTTTVKERSVTRLQGDRAELLLFVDQHARRANAPGENAGPAQISVSAVKQGGTWKISQITLR